MEMRSFGRGLDDDSDEAEEDEANEEKDELEPRASCGGGKAPTNDVECVEETSG